MKAVLDASDAAGVKRVLAVLIQASKDAPVGGVPLASEAARAPAAAAAPARPPPPASFGGSSGMDGGTRLVARIDELGADARRPITPRPLPPDNIPTLVRRFREHATVTQLSNQGDGEVHFMVV